MRKQIVNTIYSLLQPQFKSGFKNYIPPMTSVKSFPAFALAVDSEKRQRVMLNGCAFNAELNIVCIIYYKSSKNNFEGDISEVIDDVISVLNDNSTLNGQVIDCFVDKIIQDGGVINPYSVAELNIKVTYRK